MTRRARWTVTLGAFAVLAACGGEPPASHREIRLTSDNFVFRISTDPMPPHARESHRWTVVIEDRETRQPVQSGEGRIFATSRDNANTWDGFAKEQEVGAFSGRLNFLTAGEWAMAVQFRADSTRPLDRVDWIQEVRPERPIGS